MPAIDEYPDKAEAVGFSRKDISNFGEEIANILKYKIDGDIESVVNDLGGKIKYLNYDELFYVGDGTILVKGPKEFEIHIPSFTSPLRDRFTIAHEIGHYVLHSEFGKKKIIVARFGSGDIEREANWFAAGFLMPKSEFKKALDDSFSNYELSAKFNVSKEAIDVRRRELTNLR